MATEGVSSLRSVGRIALIAVALCLLAGCGDDQHAQPEPARTPPAALRPPTTPPKPHLSYVHVIVLDGDTSAPVRAALVRVGTHAARTQRDGVARIRIGRHARLPVSVAKAGYDPYQQRLQFRGKP